MKKALLCVAACLMALTTFATELNIYASGLKAGGMSADKHVQVEYLLNAPATSLVIDVLNADESVAMQIPLTDTTYLSKGRHAVSLNLAILSEGTYAWRVTAAAEARANTENVPTPTRQFTIPRGVAVDWFPEHASFGNIYVTDPVGAVVDGAGIWMYDASLATTLTDFPYLNGSFNAGSASPMRVYAAEDGLVYISDWGDSNPNVTIFDPANPTAEGVKVFTGTSNNDGIETTAGGDAIHGSIPACVVLGSGADRKMYTTDEDIAVLGTSTGNIYRYDIGELTSVWNTTPSAIVYDDGAHNNILQNGNINIWPDSRGGFWASQHRWTDGAAIPALIHVNASGVPDYISGSMGDVNNRGAIAINKSESLIAIPALGDVRIYTITWDENNVPTLSLNETLSAAITSGGCYDMAFDCADNLYMVNNATSLVAYALPKADNSFTTPAPAAQAIVITNTIVNVTGVTLDAETADMKVGEQKTLVATVAPADATNKSVTWSSSDETIATVTSEGQVSALKAGSVTITVTTADGEMTASCVITITNVDVESVELNRSHIYIYPGDNNQLTATVAPANATIKDVTYASSDTTVAVVSAEGLITAVGVGEATITVTTVDGGKTASCIVTVNAPEYPNVMAYGLKLEDAENLTIGFNLNAPAIQVQVLAYDSLGEEYVVATAANLAPEYQTLALNTDDLPAGTYTWAVKANGVEDEEVYEPVLVHAYSTPKFVKPRGVAMDNNYNSPYFGQIYVADAGSAVENSGMYIFDPVLTGDGEIHTSGWSASPASPMRPHVGEDGLVYITDWSDNAGNIHIFDPANPIADEQLVFGGTFSGAGGIWNTEDGKYIHGSLSSCYVTGTGADRVLYTFDEDYTPEVGHAMCMLRYDIGALETPWAAVPSAVAYNNADNFEQNGDSKIIPSVMGGWWISQDRAADSHDIPALIHVAADGTVNYNSNGALGGRSRGALAFNEDQTLCLTAADNAIRIWNVTWSEDSVPTLSLNDQAITTTFGSQNSSSCYDIAIDRALNVYASGDSKPLCIWALVKDENSCITPAADALTFTVEKQDDAIEDVTAQKARRGVYDLLGRYLGETLDNMPMGVYIVNGEKVVK